MAELTEWLCTECGRKHEFTTDPDERKVCNDCGAFLKRAKEVPLSPNAALRKLIDEWNKAENTRMKAYKCANELETLIDDTQAGDADE